MKLVFKVFIRVIFSLFIITTVLGTGAFILFQTENRAVESLSHITDTEDIFRKDEGLLLRIRRGESLISLSDRLSSAGLTRSPLLWRLFPYLYGGSIKVGEYLIEEPMKASELYALFTSGKVLLHRITIPEGLTSGKIARRLEEAGFCNAEDFLAAVQSPRLLAKFGIPAKTLEGYLYPETWHFPADYPAERIADDMVSLFFKTLDEVYPAHRQEDNSERHRKVILASIVEREAYLKEEASLIAGVFFNRINISMPLQSCATVEYIITEIQGKPHPHRLYDTDIAIEHPFNTYIYPGLPPGPIANPGRTALEAVYKPQNSNYLYFRLIDANRGEHAFSKTFDEHLEYGLLFNRRTGRN